MGTVNLGQVAALIQSVEVEELPGGAMPTVRNVGTKANAQLIFGIPSIKNRLINILKNGYIQWPGMPSPLEDESLHFEGYSWHEVNYDGNFFRAKGRNAKAFSSVKLTKENIKNGTYTFGADEQGDAIRELSGTVHLEAGPTVRYANGVFYKKEHPLYQHIKWASDGHGTVHTFNMKASQIVPTAEENRGRNLTFTIWALVKDE